MTIKEMINEVLAQSGFLQKPTFNLQSRDPDDVQMVSIANRALIEIRDFYRWSCLRRTHVVDMDGSVNRYNLPSDFRDFVPDSAWETQGSRRVELPTPEGRWFLYKHTVFSDGGTIRARLYRNQADPQNPGTFTDQIEIHDPETGESFTMEYLTDQVVVNGVGDLKERFTADDDTCLLDDQLLILGIQAHWAQTKRLPQYQDWFGNYAMKRDEAIARDAGSRTIGGVGSDYDWLRSRSPYTPKYLP